MTLPNRIGLAFLGLVLLGVAALLVWMSAKNGRMAAASGSWTRVEGTIDSSETSSTWVKRGPVPTMVHAPRVTYSYEAGGSLRHGSRIGFSDEFLGVPGDDGKARAMEQAARFPAGAKVPVYVDPSDPAEATLIAGGDVPFTSFSGVGIAIFMALGGLGCLAFAFLFGRK